MPCKQHPAQALRKWPRCKFSSTRYLWIFSTSFSLSLHLFTMKGSGVGRAQGTPSTLLWAQKLSLSVDLSWKWGWGTKKKGCRVCELTWLNLKTALHLFSLLLKSNWEPEAQRPSSALCIILASLPGFLGYSSLAPRLLAVPRDARWRQVAKIRTENTYPGDDQRLVEVYAPGESEAPGRRAREDHVLGHDVFPRVSPTDGCTVRVPEPDNALSSLGCDLAGNAVREFYPCCPVTSLASPPPRPLPPRRAPTLEVRDNAWLEELLAAGCSRPDLSPPKEASGFSFHHSLK